MSNGPLVQSQSWRPQRQARAIDAWIVRAGLAAGGMFALLALGYGGYTMLGRVALPVPVVEADRRPVRVRPDNPGGMQVAGAEEQIMGDTGTGQTATMAPPPEVPQPQVLRAQIEAARQPPPAVSVPIPQAVSLPALPAPAAIAALPERRVVGPASPSRPASVSSGGVQVQLAALGTEAAATAEWQRVSKLLPGLFASRHPDVQRADRDGKTYYRLRTGSFGNAAEATSFCTQLKAKGAGCAIASF